VRPAIGTTPEHVEEARRHRLPGYPFGQGSGSAQRLAAAGNGRYGRERSVLLAPVHVVQRRDAVVGRLGRRFPEHDERVGFAVGQRAQQGRVEQAEDRGGCPDAQGEDHDRQRSERWGSPEHASTVSKVAPECHASFDESWRLGVGEIHSSNPGQGVRSPSVG
jgi:hypothetical protein